VLEELLVHDGEYVEKGQVLAVFNNRELQTQLLEAQAQHEIREMQVRSKKDQLRDTSDTAEKPRLRSEIAQLEGERLRFAAEIATLKQNVLDKLELRAPRDGTVMSCPTINDVGKFWDKSVETPFCKVGDPTKLRALIPITPAEYSLLKENEEQLRKHGGIPVTIRVQGRDSRTWQGELGELPSSEAANIPLPLTSKAGGPIATKPNRNPGINAPQAQVYLAHVHFVDPDGAVYPGSMAQVKIHCRWESFAWWTWRTICDVFEIRLL
jgi:putative peptide zinc metalloprotease protein